jgi:hypothetical protein
VFTFRAQLFTFPRSLFDGVHFSRLAYPKTTLF